MAKVRYITQITNIIAENSRKTCSIGGLPDAWGFNQEENQRAPQGARWNRFYALGVSNKRAIPML